MVVTKKEGKTYAFNNKCPHLGLSLKRGEITGSDDRHGVCVVCPYHKSKFSLEDGKCKVWSESVLGIKGTEALGEKIGSFVAPMVSIGCTRQSLPSGVNPPAHARVLAVALHDACLGHPPPPLHSASCTCTHSTVALCHRNVRLHPK